MTRLSLPWPSPLRRRLIRLYITLATRYGPEDRGPARSAFEVIAGAIVAQNTAAVNVKAVVASLRRAGATTPAGVERLAPARLRALLRPLGPAARPVALATRLRALAAHVRQRHGGVLRAFLTQPAGDLRAALLALPGITPRTADTVLLHAAGRPVFVVDPGAGRVLARHRVTAPRVGYAELQALFHQNLPHDPALFREYQALLQRVAREHCGTVPRCDRCPLRADLRGQGPRRLG